MRPRLARLVRRARRGRRPAAHGAPVAGQAKAAGARRRNRAACSTSPSARTRRRASPSTRSRPSRPTWPAMPCFNNLVLFDPLKQQESVDTVIGELAEKWSWQDNYRNLVFFLRKNVKWHDGQPFTSKDVKFTFDMLREAPDAAGKLRINPRKDWYANVQNVEAPDPYTVDLPPQAAAALAAAHDGLRLHADLRRPRPARAVPHRAAWGPGPYKLKEWRKGEFIEYVKNPDYFVKGRPLPRRHQVHRHQGARHPRGRAAGRAGRRGASRVTRARPPPSSSRRRCPSSWSRAPPRT